MLTDSQFKSLCEYDTIRRAVRPLIQALHARLTHRAATFGDLESWRSINASYATRTDLRRVLSAMVDEGLVLERKASDLDGSKTTVFALKGALPPREIQTFPRPSKTQKAKLKELMALAKGGNTPIVTKASLEVPAQRVKATSKPKPARKSPTMADRIIATVSKRPATRDELLHRLSVNDNSLRGRLSELVRNRKLFLDDDGVYRVTH